MEIENPRDLTKIYQLFEDKLNNYKSNEDLNKTIWNLSINLLLLNDLNIHPATMFQPRNQAEVSAMPVVGETNSNGVIISVRRDDIYTTCTIKNSDGQTEFTEVKFNGKCICFNIKRNNNNQKWYDEFFKKEIEEYGEESFTQDGITIQIPVADNNCGHLMQEIEPNVCEINIEKFIEKFIKPLFNKLIYTIPVDKSLDLIETMLNINILEQEDTRNILLNYIRNDINAVNIRTIISKELIEAINSKDYFKIFELTHSNKGMIDFINSIHYVLNGCKEDLGEDDLEEEDLGEEDLEEEELEHPIYQECLCKIETLRNILNSENGFDNIITVYQNYLNTIIQNEEELCNFTKKLIALYCITYYCRKQNVSREEYNKIIGLFRQVIEHEYQDIDCLCKIIESIYFTGYYYEEYGQECIEYDYRFSKENNYFINITKIIFSKHADKIYKILQEVNLKDNFLNGSYEGTEIGYYYGNRFITSKCLIIPIQEVYKLINTSDSFEYKIESAKSLLCLMSFIIEYNVSNDIYIDIIQKVSELLKGINITDFELDIYQNIEISKIDKTTLKYLLDIIKISYNNSLLISKLEQNNNVYFEKGNDYNNNIKIFFVQQTLICRILKRQGYKFDTEQDRQILSKMNDCIVKFKLYTFTEGKNRYGNDIVFDNFIKCIDNCFPHLKEIFQEEINCFELVNNSCINNPIDCKNIVPEKINKNFVDLFLNNIYNRNLKEKKFVGFSFINTKKDNEIFKTNIRNIVSLMCKCNDSLIQYFVDNLVDLQYCDTLLYIIEQIKTNNKNVVISKNFIDWFIDDIKDSEKTSGIMFNNIFMECTNVKINLICSNGSKDKIKYFIEKLKEIKRDDIRLHIEKQINEINEEKFERKLNKLEKATEENKETRKIFQEQQSEIKNFRQTVNTMQQQFINGFNFVQQPMNVFNHQSVQQTNMMQNRLNFVPQVQQTNMVQNRLNFVPPVQQINMMQQQGLLGNLNLSINAFSSINDINKGGKK